MPKKILTNDDLSKFLDTSNSWIKERTGILQRHVVQKEFKETCSSMALEASKKALEMAKLKPTDLDLIIVATLTPDYRMPNASCVLQEALGSINVPAFDISAACAGSVYGLNIAHNFIKSGQCQNVLFVGAEVMSSVINWQDRNTAILFGDGASAAILTKTTKEDQGFLDFKLYADGRQKNTITWPASGSYYPPDEEAIKKNLDKIFMNGRETYKFAVRALCDLALEMLDRNNLNPKDIDFVVPHQANLRIIEAISERIGISKDRFLINLDKCANTSSASLLMAYDEAFRDKKITSGDLIMMMAIGGGFAWGAALYQT